MSAIITYHNIGRHSNKYLSQLLSIEIDSFHMKLQYLKFFYKDIFENTKIWLDGKRKWLCQLAQKK